MTQPALYRHEFKAMACACEIQLAPPPGQSLDVAARLAAQAAAEVHRIETKYSRYRADSLISRINAAAGQSPVPCDDETRHLFNFAQQMYEQSQGLFDITSGIYRRAWDFKSGSLPSEEQLAALRPLVNWAAVEWCGRHIRLPHAGMEIDLGGFGKEYAADRAAHLLRQQGIHHGLVNLGGDIATVGGKPDGSNWLAGIQHPRRAGHIMAEVPLQDQALATSGDYERFIEIGGQRYCHILNPQTGWPVRHYQSVSVVAPSCILAGALSTTIMLLEDKAGESWISNLQLPVLTMDQVGHLGH